MTETIPATTEFICSICGQNVEIQKKNGNETAFCKNCKREITAIRGNRLKRFICLGDCRGGTIIVELPNKVKKCSKCGSNEIYEMED